MLLDQKRTRFWVKVVSITAAVAFAGVIFVVLGVVLSGGGGSSSTGGSADLIKQAQKGVAQHPRSADAWEELASRYADAQQLDQAVNAAERAASLEPRDYSRTQTLVAFLDQTGATPRAMTALQRFTARNPGNAQAFLELGLHAQQLNRIPLAKLAFAQFLQLAPNDPNAVDVRTRLAELRKQPTTGATPATPAAPATPATP